MSYNYYKYPDILGAFGLFTLQGDTPSPVIPIVYWVMPLTVMVVLYYEAYKLRELAILKGYLAVIEDEINQIIVHYGGNKEVFRWFVQYKIYYSTKGNNVKKYILIPAIMALLFVNFIGVYEAGATMYSREGEEIVFYVYYVMVAVILFLDVLAVYSIIHSRGIKYEVYRDEEISDKAKEIWKESKKRRREVNNAT